MASAALTAVSYALFLILAISLGVCRIALIPDLACAAAGSGSWLVCEHSAPACGWSLALPAHDGDHCDPGWDHLGTALLAAFSDHLRTLDFGPGIFADQPDWRFIRRSTFKKAFIEPGLMLIAVGGLRLWIT